MVKNNYLKDVLSPTAKQPPHSDVVRLDSMMRELCSRMEMLAASVASHKPLNVQVAAAPASVVVEAAKVTIPAPIVNVAQPEFKMDNATVNVAAPEVHVTAPAVTVNPPQVHVSAPIVTVAAPSVSVAAPSVTVNPVINSAYPRTLTFSHELDHKGNVIKSTVTASE